MPAALAEIARQSLRDDFRNIHPESARIVLLDGSPHVLATFPEPLRKAARRSLERLGVEVRTESIVTAVDAEGVSWRPVPSSWHPAPSSWRPASAGPEGVSAAPSSNAAEERIVAQTVLWAAGVAARQVAGRAARSRRTHVGRADAGGSGAPRAVRRWRLLFAAAGREAAARRRAGVAKQEGAHAARNVLHAIRGEGLESFRYRDYGTMATIGRGSAVADIGPIKASGFFAWLIWLFAHIFWLIEFRNRMAVMGEWAWAYMTFQRRVRLITGEKMWPGW